MTDFGMPEWEFGTLELTYRTYMYNNEAVAWLDEPTFCITFRQRQAANLYRKWLTSTGMDCVEPVDGK